MEVIKILEHVSNAVGLDEAGRGPLAGPVVAAAVWLPDGFDLTGLDDSKRLSRIQREELETRLRSVPHAIASIEPEEIDRINILQASLRAMVLALAELEASLPAQVGRILVDGNRLPVALQGRGEAWVKGDGRFACIAGASILAKTHRDRLMLELAERYPLYGFEAHFGYPTPQHLQALAAHGPCPIHRHSYRPVAQFSMPSERTLFE